MTRGKLATQQKYVNGELACICCGKVIQDDSKSHSKTYCSNKCANKHRPLNDEGKFRLRFNVLLSKGVNITEQEKKSIKEMIKSVEYLALAHFLTGEEKYAAEAARCLRGFFLEEKTRMNPNLNYLS